MKNSKRARRILEAESYLSTAIAEQARSAFQYEFIVDEAREALMEAIEDLVNKQG